MEERAIKSKRLIAPFPWFGGKRRAAHLIWPRLGDVDHYVEPFAGGLAVLLARPTEPKLETVNDIDAYICNFWRAVQYAPDEVAYWANWPVNEVDLTARHIWLVQTAPERLARLQGDPTYYDAQIAGWWVWGINLWIGTGWCSGNGPWTSQNGELVKRTSKNVGGVSRQLPSIGHGGRGVHRKLPMIAHNRRLTGRQAPTDGGEAMGESERQRAALIEYMYALADRLRHVRVCCGDWTRVVTKGALSGGKTVGVLLDPPYDQKMRAGELYTHDAHGISKAVRDWALEHGDNPRYRIALCGYEGEHEMPPDWECVAWSAVRAFGNSRGATANSDNRHKERIWFSPHCLKPMLLGCKSELLIGREREREEAGG